MGSREDLLDGAKRCLFEKGYGRTTARDIVAASGTNLASISYHYGSKEALLNLALLDALGDTGEEVRRATRTCMNLDADPFERFEVAWDIILDQYFTRRQLLLASVEIFAQVDRVPGLRAAVADGFQQGCAAMVELFKSISGDALREMDRESVEATGPFFQALATGVMAQCLVDPGRAPTARDLAAALRAVMAWSRSTERASGDTAAEAKSL